MPCIEDNLTREFFLIYIVFAAEVGPQSHELRTAVKSVQVWITVEKETVGQARFYTCTDPLDGIVGLAAHGVGRGALCPRWWV